MADNLSARRAAPFPGGGTKTGTSSLLLAAGRGRLSACRASFIHPNLNTLNTLNTLNEQTPPRRQDSFDSLNYSSASSSSSSSEDYYENENWTAAELEEKLKEDRPAEQKGAVIDDCDGDMAHIRSLVCDDDEVEEIMDGKDNATVAASTRQEMEWFKLAGLTSLVTKLLDNDDGKCEDVQLETLTKSQTDTVRRRLASLRNTISGHSSQLTLDGLSRRATLTETDLVSVPGASQSYSGKGRVTRKPHWRDVRDVFNVERRSSSSSESQDGDHDIDSSNPSSRSDFISSMDSVDTPLTPSPSTPSTPPENSVGGCGAFHQREAYCLTQPLHTPPKVKGKNVPHRWRAPLGGQAAADVVSHDQETGVRILKINYRSGYDTVVEEEGPLPLPVWPKVTQRTPMAEDIFLEFAYRPHPAGSPDPDWPNVVMRRTPNGICDIEDLLWEGDEMNVKQLSLIELTRIFDEHQLPMQKRPIKLKKKIKNSPDMGIFGSSLDRLIVLDNNRRGSDNMLVGEARLATHVPIVFHQMLNYLEECGGIDEEGILRICGETNRMRRLRGDLDAFYSNPVTEECLQPTDERQWFRRVFQTASVHDVASVMKQFLRDLPQPLLTDDLVDAFAQISDIPDRLTQIQALNLLVLQLPLAERATLKAVLRTLRKMVEGEKKNKMSSANIAMIMAPNLFHPKGVTPPSPHSQHNFFSSTNKQLNERTNKRSTTTTKDVDPARQFNLVAKLSDVTRIMIVYSHLLFTVPPSFLRQIRTSHTRAVPSEKKKERRIRRLNPRLIVKGSKGAKGSPLPVQGEEGESTFFQQQFPQDEVVVIRVRLKRRYANDDDHHHKVSTAVEVTSDLTAGDVVAKFLTDNLTSSLEDKLNLSTSSGVSGSDKSSSSSNEDLLNIDGRRGRQSLSPRRETEPSVTLQTYYLVEQGGNIGLRRLDHDVSVLAAHQSNPKATWIVRYFPDL